jgi:ABC-type transport system involved in cytochrome bd biosynthesis fused ATPase/permease subunit
MLKEISFDLEKSGLITIVGAVGAGKSSLLLSLLGELELLTGNVDIKGSLFYVSQEPWIFPASLKQNILFGKKYDEKKFTEILKVSCLEQVINI